ncbi:DNA methyltransferase, partial [Helicobacter sp. T3_23-1059]
EFVNSARKLDSDNSINSPSLAEGDKGGGYKNALTSKNATFANAESTLPLASLVLREGEQSPCHTEALAEVSQNRDFSPTAQNDKEKDISVSVKPQYDNVDCHDFAKQNLAMTDNANSHLSSNGAEVSLGDFVGCEVGSEGVCLSQMTEADNAHSRKSDKETTPPDIILDFFAGSGTTAHAVMELNRTDNGNRKCILVTNNEITDINPNGIAIDVTTKRLKRIMSGECYDGNKDFKWREKNAPYKDNLEVYQIAKISKYAQDSTHPLTPSAREGESMESPRAMEGEQNADSRANANFREREGEFSGNPLDLIDECAYNLPRFESIHNKAKWIAQNFGITLNTIESDSEYIKRTKGITQNTQNPHNHNAQNPQNPNAQKSSDKGE